MQDLTYDDLYCHVDILKNLMKVANIGNCYLWGASSYSPDGRKLIAHICQWHFPQPNNYTLKDVAAIYADGHVQTDCLNDEQLHYIYMWLTFITTPQKRHNDRVRQIKDELLAVCYHPDNVFKLMPITINLKKSPPK